MTNFISLSISFWSALINFPLYSVSFADPFRARARSSLFVRFSRVVSLLYTLVCCTKPRAISPGSARESCSCTLGGGTQALKEFAAPLVRPSVRVLPLSSLAYRPSTITSSFSSYFVSCVCLPSSFILLSSSPFLPPSRPSHPLVLVDDYFPFPSRRPRRVTCKPLLATWVHVAAVCTRMRLHECACATLCVHARVRAPPRSSAPLRVEDTTRSLSSSATLRER